MILDFFIATKDSVFLDKSIADRSRFIEIFSVVMIFVFVTYGLYNIAIAGKTLIGALEVLLSLLLFFNIRITLDKKRNYFLAASVLLTVLITMALVVFAYGGVEKTGKMWLFTVPIIIYFFMGRERGNKWMISFFLSYTAIGTLMTYNMIPPTYGLKELLLTFFALFIESVLVYYYALTKDSAYLSLQKQEENLKNILNGIEEIIYRTSKDGVITYISEHIEKVLGYKTSEIINTKISDLHYESDGRTKFLENMEKNNGRVENYKTKLIHKNGHIIWIMTNARMIKDVNGEFLGVEGISRDVTELVNAKEKLQDLNKKLEQRVEEEVKKNREKDMLLANQSRLAAMGEMINAISHQWRQPLNSLGLTIQNLQEAYNYNELDKKLIDSTVEESMGKLTYMSNTIDDFRNFFKSDKTKKLFNIKNIIDSSINILDAQMKFHNISWEIEGEDFTVEGQESEFSQVLIVLINNSKDAIIDKKEKNKEFKGKIKIYLDKEKKSIYVEDNGGGIQEENLEKIFDPYFTTKFQSQGTGIGLYMAKNIISNNLAGSLTVSNTKDGAKFKISLP